MLQTAYGSLTIGLDAQPGQTLLIRGGTSSVGMATALLAKRQGMTVLSTTRNAAAPGCCSRRRRPRARRRRRRGRARSVRSFPTASTPPRSWSARRPCPTRCGPARARRRVLHRDVVEPVDRAGLLPDRLPAARRSADGLRRRAPAICPPRCCRTSSTPSPRATPWCPIDQVYASTRSSQAHAAMEAGRAGKAGGHHVADRGAELAELPRSLTG